MIPYLIKNFRGGTSLENDKGVAGAFKYGSALDIHKRNDSLTCKQALSTVLGESIGVLGSNTGTTMTGIVNVFLPASDGSTYAFTDQGSIWCRSGDSQWNFVYNDEAGKITGAEEFKDTNGDNYIFWATSSMISRKPFPGSNSAPDTGTMRWTDVTWEWKIEFVNSAAAWHTMKMINGALYIANGEYLSELDFSANWSPVKMNVRPGNLIKCLEERNDYAIMGSTLQDENEESYLWSWISTASNFIQKKKVPAKGVNALITGELPLLQAGTAGQLYVSDFASVVPIHTIPGGGQVNPGGVAFEDSLSVFGFYGGTGVSSGLWSYGRKAKNRAQVLNYEYRLVQDLAGSTISTLGAVVNINGVLLASWGTTDSHTSGNTSEYGIDQVNTTTKATGTYEGLEFDGGAPHLQKKFDTVKVITAPLTSGTSYSIKFKLNKDTSWKYAVLGDRSTTYSTANSTAAIFSIGRPAEIFELGAELNPSSNETPEILSITTYIANEKNEF